MSTVMISEKLNEILQDRYGEDCHESIELRDSYSGRFMYGECCFGITTNGEIAPFAAIADIMEEIKYSCSEDEFMTVFDEFTRLMRKAKMDNMGMGVIIYFPGYTLRVKEDAEAE